MPRDIRFSHKKREHKSSGRKGVKRTLSIVLASAIVLLVFGVLYGFRAVLFPFMIAAIVAYILGPVVEKLCAARLPRALAVMIVLLVFVGSICSFVYSFFPQFSEEGQQGIARIQTFLENAPALYERWEGEVQVWVSGDEPAAPPLDMETPSEKESLDTVLLGPAPNIVVEPLADGAYGIRLEDSSFRIETENGGGTLRLGPSDEEASVRDFSALKKELVGNITRGLQSFSKSLMAGFLNMVRSLITGVLGALIGILLTFMAAGFLLLEMPRIRKGFAELVPTKYADDYQELLTNLDEGFSGVVRGQLLICLVNGVLSFIGFLIFIPKYALVMGMLAGVMSLIPIFGTIISSVPVVLVGLTDSVGTALGLLGWILGIHFIEGNFLNPKIIGNAARINPVLVIFVLVAGEQTFGIAGALLAVPALSLLQTFVVFTYRRIRPQLEG